MKKVVLKKTFEVFKRWTRNSYGVFASMHKVVGIGVLSLSCSLLIQLSASAQSKGSTDSIKTLKLSTFEAIAQRQNVYSSLARNFTVVSHDEIESSPSLSLSQLLREVPGLDIRQRGDGDVQSDISIRGGSTDQMLVLLNGIDVTDPQTGHYALDLPVDISSIRRIEVLRGPAARLLGANAFSGAINIITNNYTSGGVVQLVAGQHGLISPKISYNYVKGCINAFGSASYSRSEGYMFNTDFNIANTFASVSIDSTFLGKVNFQAGYKNKSYGANSFYSIKYPNQYEKTNTMFSSLSSDMRLTNNISLSPKVYWREHLDCFQLFRDFTNAPSWYISHNYHQTDIVGVGTTINYYSKIGTTSIGLESRYEHIYSNVLGDDISNPFKVWFTSDSVYFTKEKGRTNVYAFFNQSIHFKKISISAGGNVIYSNDFGSHYCFGGDLAYQIIRGLNITASIDQAIRLPSFTDLYYNSATQIANPDLKPEKAITYELGISKKTNSFNATVSCFYRNGNNVIDWVRYIGDEVWHSMNHTEVNALGGEAYIEYLFPRIYYIKKIQASVTALTIDKHSGDYISKYALDYLKQKFTFSLEHKIYKYFSADWRFIYQKRGGNYIDVENITRTYDNVFLTDLRIKWQKKSRSVWVEADNLFNRTYYDYGGIIQPGIWIKGGISIDF